MKAIGIDIGTTSISTVAAETEEKALLYLFEAFYRVEQSCNR